MADHPNDVQVFTPDLIDPDSTVVSMGYIRPTASFVPVLASNAPTGGGQLPDVAITFTVNVSPEA